VYPQCGLLLGGYRADALCFRLCSTALRMLLLLGMLVVYVNVVCNVNCVAYTPEPKDLACQTPTPKATGRSLHTKPHSIDSHPGWHNLLKKACCTSASTPELVCGSNWTTCQATGRPHTLTWRQSIHHPLPLKQALSSTCSAGLEVTGRVQPLKVFVARHTITILCSAADCKG
jgi:hypothetical protein